MISHVDLVSIRQLSVLMSGLERLCSQCQPGRSLGWGKGLTRTGPDCGVTGFKAEHGLPPGVWLSAWRGVEEVSSAQTNWKKFLFHQNAWSLSLSTQVTVGLCKPSLSVQVKRSIWWKRSVVVKASYTSAEPCPCCYWSISFTRERRLKHTSVHYPRSIHLCTWLNVFPWSRQQTTHHTPASWPSFRLMTDQINTVARKREQGEGGEWYLPRFMGW